MDLSLLFQGMLLGLAIAAPVGPIGVLCIRRTLADGVPAGLASGLGAASADMLYGLVAALGLRAVSDLLLGAELWVRLLGGAFLCYLGLRTLLARPAEQAAPARAGGLLGAYASTFLLTITNPATILAFTAIFAGMGAASELRSTGAALSLVVGVALGSALWWVTLSGGVGLLRQRVSPAALGWVNRGSGLVILGFGLAALASLI